MAMFEEQITDTLETGAPPIKYEGDEGPQDPRQEAMLAQLKEEYMQYVFEMRELDEPIMSFEEWYQMTYEASKMGVQAPQEEMMSEEMMMREPAAYGGIMDTESGRRMYGLGSFFKKITKPFKKIAKGAKKIFKSPVGKMGLAALLAGPALGALTGSGAATSLGTSLHGGAQFGAKKGIGALLKGAARKAIPHLTNPKTLAKIGIGAASALPLLGIGTQTKQDQLPDAGGKFDFDYDKMIRRGQNLKSTQDIIDYNKEYGTDLVEDEEVYRTGNAQGGRIGFALGSKADFAIEDVMTGGVEDELGGITGIMRQADLQRKGNIGQFYAAEGGSPSAVEREIEFWKSQGMSDEEALEAIIQRKPRGKEIREPFYPDRFEGKEIREPFYPHKFPDLKPQPMAEGGIMDLGGMEKDYRETGGFVDLGAEEKADDVPARLSVNEFVMTADAVRGAGDGDIDLGAERMEDVMKTLEQKGKKENMKMAGPDWYIKRIEHLMFLGYDYDEAADIAYDSDKYYEIVGDPGEARREGASDMFEVSERLSEVV